VTEVATLKTDKKTSKIGVLFIASCLGPNKPELALAKMLRQANAV